MSEESDNRVRGPVMLAATNMLKPPPAVIGSLNKDITLPRTLKLTTVVAMGVGTVLGFILALFIVGPSLEALMYGPTLGGAIGWAASNFSPLPGESLAKWIGLQANSSRKRKLLVDGEPVRLYVGIAPLRRTAAGTIRMIPGGVPVDAVRWDERGIPQQEIPVTERINGRAGSAAKLTASTQMSSQNLRAGRKRRSSGRRK
ncbi:hypothetical protein ACRYCC_13115 [Actinomadura scrupuli]|uniref:hypothetical protein n=1 Tax=Actinomadura scrupuli TaxID=559629 RepID=UPI003D98673B